MYELPRAFPGMNCARKDNEIHQVSHQLVEVQTHGRLPAATAACGEAELSCLHSEEGLLLLLYGVLKLNFHKVF